MHPTESTPANPRREVPFPVIPNPQPKRKGCHPKGRNEVEDVRSTLTPLERRLPSAPIPPTDSPEDPLRRWSQSVPKQRHRTLRVEPERAGRFYGFKGLWRGGKSVRPIVRSWRSRAVLQRTQEPGALRGEQGAVLPLRSDHQLLRRPGSRSVARDTRSRERC